MQAKPTYRLISCVEYSLHDIRPRILNATGKLLGAKSEQRDYLKLITIKYQLDRVTSTPLSILKLVKTDPVLVGPDIAALFRGMFEAVINLLYLLDDSDGSRFAAFYSTAYEAEKKMQDAISTWQGHADQWIALNAEHQMKVQGGPSKVARAEILGILGIVEPPKYPNIYDRCAKLGPTWQYLYDSRYRGLSAWQHGDMSRGHVSSSLLFQIPTHGERTVFETMIIVMWTWELTHKFAYALFKLANNFDDLEWSDSLNMMCNDVAAQCLQSAAQKFQLSELDTEQSTAITTA